MKQCIYLLAALLAAALPGLSPSALAQTHPDFTGKWRAVGLGSRILTAGGKPPPLLAKIAPGTPDHAETASCLAPGTPRIFFEPGAFVIVQRPYQILFLFEYQRLFRRVFMTDLGGEIDPTFMGHSVGHWDGDTLVVDTTSFESQTKLDPAGTPHSDALKLTERFTLKDPATLEDVMLVTDPGVFSAPWQTKFEFKRQPGTRLAEDACPDRISGDK